MNDDKEIEIVKGDGDLEISPVYTHININKKNDDYSRKNIIIPEERKSNKDKKEE